MINYKIGYTEFFHSRNLFSQETINNIPTTQNNQLFAWWVILHAFLSFVDCFLQNQHFRKIVSDIPSECQTDWTQVRADVNVGPDLGSICLQSLWVDGTSNQGVTVDLLWFLEL